MIPHPTKPGKRIIHASLEGPENGVYSRGRVTGNGTAVMHVPAFWDGLVDPETITVQLTPIGRWQKLYVDVEDGMILVISDAMIDRTINAHYVIHGERIDIPRLEVEQ